MCRSYSSDTGAWGPEGKVSGTSISGRRLGEMDAGVAFRGAVFWLSHTAVFGLRVDTLHATRESRTWNDDYCYCHGRLGDGSMNPSRRLIVFPDGRLRVVQVGGYRDTGNFGINFYTRDETRTRHRWVWDKERDIDLAPWLLYVLDLEKRTVQLIPGAAAFASRLGASMAMRWIGWRIWPRS